VQYDVPQRQYYTNIPYIDKKLVLQIVLKLEFLHPHSVWYPWHPGWNAVIRCCTGCRPVQTWCHWGSTLSPNVPPPWSIEHNNVRCGIFVSFLPRRSYNGSQSTSVLWFKLDVIEAVLCTRMYLLPEKVV